MDNPAAKLIDGLMIKSQHLHKHSIKSKVGMIYESFVCRYDFYNVLMILRLLYLSKNSGPILLVYQFKKYF